MNSKSFKTLYLDVSTVSALIKKVGLRSVLSELMDFIREDYANWTDFVKCPRTANHAPLGVIELMPVSNSKQFAFKYVNGHPKNPDIGLTTVMAFGALAEMSTGFPILLSEMTLLTALRTAATSVLAGTYLARKNSSSMAMIGNGAQSEFQILAFNEILGVEHFNLFDVDEAATDKLIENLRSDTNLKLHKSQSTGEAVRGADMVTTCTADKKRATILTLDMVEEGMFINAIGGDCPGKTELQKEILDRASVFVEYAPQTRIEGEIQQMSPDYRVIELYEVVKGEKEGRKSDAEITIFDSVGFSLEDYSVLRYFYKLATDNKVGKEVEIIPDLGDVKDLYSLVR